MLIKKIKGHLMQPKFKKGPGNCQSEMSFSYWRVLVCYLLRDTVDLTIYNCFTNQKQSRINVALDPKSQDLQQSQCSLLLNSNSFTFQNDTTLLIQASGKKLLKSFSIVFLTSGAYSVSRQRMADKQLRATKKLRIANNLDARFSVGWENWW